MKSNPATICVPVRVERASEIAEAIALSTSVADIIEVRLDYVADSEWDQVRRELPAHLLKASVQVVLTMRSSDQGGHAPDDYEVRARFWSSLGDLPNNCLIDLELDLATVLMARAESLPLNWGRIICSFHDFTGIPSQLEEIYERMASMPARILKIAVQADDATDCLPIFRLLERARREGREMIAIAMGQAGIMTRVLGPSRGSFLTYGSLDDESATAPGQLTATELRQIYRIDQIDQQTQICGLMGRPVSHSISPHIHNAAFAAAKLNAVYIPFDVRDASQFLRRMMHPRSRELEWEVRGLSVTAPHKGAVINGLDWIDPTAKEIGAVNTIVVQDDELHGYNTDAAAFIAPLQRRFGALRNVRCAVIGAGGGARAALWALRNEGAEVEMFVREVDRTKSTAKEFDVNCRPLVGASFDGFNIVINATPLGTQGERQGETPATAQQLRNVRLAYDLVYNPLETRFLREARAAGCETLGGIEMLLAQAVEQFKLWTGREPELEVMRAAALGALAK